MHILVHRNKRYCVSIINIVLDKYCIIMKVSNFQEDNTRQMHDVCTTDASKAKVWSIKFFILAIQRVDTLYIAHIIKFQMWHVIEENEN